MRKLLIFTILFVSVSSYAQSDTSIIVSDLEKSVQDILIEVQKTNKFLTNSDEIEKLREENLKLEEKIINLENSKSVKNNKSLKEKNEDLVNDLQLKKDKLSNLNTEIMNQVSEISSLNDKVKKLENTITQNNKYKENEKIFILEQIEFIIKQKSGTLSKKILDGLIIRSRKFNIDKNIISQYNNYIKHQNILVETKEVLDVSFNSKNVENQIDILDNLDFSSFESLHNEMYNLYDILDTYKVKCTSLSVEFADFVTYRMSNEEIINHIDLIKNEYKEYPYLFKKIEEKLNSPNKVILIDCN
jgi:uncharacterized protein YoxC